MDNRRCVQQLSGDRYRVGHSDDPPADSPFSESYSFLFDSRSTSIDLVDDAIPPEADGSGCYQTNHDYAGSEDASAVGGMLIAMLNRFDRHCAKAEQQLKTMQSQNAAQSAEIQGLKERVRTLEALLPPTPRLATPPYNDRGLRAPPSTPHLRSPQRSETPVEAATIESGRVVKMMGGERPRELYTARRTGPTPNAPGPMLNATGPMLNGNGPIPSGRAELARAGFERTFVQPAATLTPRPRRPPSPKPPPPRNNRHSPPDAPPLPMRSATNPDIHRIAAR